jgi:Lysozyme like domain
VQSESARRPKPYPASPDASERPARRATWPAVVPRAAAIGLAAALAVTTLAASATVPASKSVAKKHVRAAYLQPVGTLVQDHFLPGPLLTGDVGTVGVPTDTPPVPKTVNPTVAAEQAPAIAAYQGAAGTLSPAAIATLALQHGCAPGAAVVATAIAMAESGGSPGAQGDIGLMTPVWDWSAGLWQIRGLRAERNTGALRDSIANQDVEKNAAAMSTISQSCSDWTPWSTYNTGAYRAYLPVAQSAVEYAVGYANAHGGHYPPVPAPDPNATVPVQSSGAGQEAAAAQAAPQPARSSSAARPRTSTAAKPAPTSRAAAGRTSAAAAPAGTTAAAPTRSSAGGLPLPLPTKTTTVPLPTLKVPLPSTTLPIPLPTLTLPKLP